jgi:predicted CoA-binding protein
MTSMQEIHDFLDLKRFAFVGVSRQPKDFSRALFREFLARGYQAVPVNPDADEIDGQPCFARLQEIQPPVEGVLFMTAPAVTDTLVRDCADAGIKRVWMFRGGGKGAATADAINFCESHGIPVIPGECPFMYLPGGAWYHRFHGLVKKIAGSYPH